MHEQKDDCIKSILFQYANAVLPTWEPDRVISIKEVMHLEKGLHTESRPRYQYVEGVDESIEIGMKNEVW